MVMTEPPCLDLPNEIRNTNVNPMPNASTASLLSQSTTSTLVAPCREVGAPPASPTKDYESAFADLLSKYGMAGHVPNLNAMIGPAPNPSPLLPNKRKRRHTTTFMGSSFRKEAPSQLAGMPEEKEQEGGGGEGGKGKGGVGEEDPECESEIIVKKGKRWSAKNVFGFLR
jgi:hypothetical protein